MGLCFIDRISYLGLVQLALGSLLQTPNRYFHTLPRYRINRRVKNILPDNVANSFLKIVALTLKLFSGNMKIHHRQFQRFNIKMETWEICLYHMFCILKGCFLKLFLFESYQISYSYVN